MSTRTKRTPFDEMHRWLQDEMRRRMPDHIRRLSLPPGEICLRQRNALRALLAHAIANCPFHAARLGGLDTARVELDDLGTLPVMTKGDLMGAFDDVVADRRLDRRLVEVTLARTGQEPVPLFDEYVCMASGGSSGRRGLFVLDREALVEFFCALQRTAMRRLSAVGGPPPGGLVIAMIAANSAIHPTGIAPAVTAGSPAPMVAVPVTLPLADLVGRLETIQPHVLYGYPSMLARLAAEQRAGRMRLSPGSVTALGETLLEEDRAAIADGFAVPISNTFGSSEGFVGASEPDGEALQFNSDMCIAELVDEHDRPVTPGTPSAKVLLTNLYNRAQPLIRYELTDRLIQLPPDGSGHLRATVEGRADDILRLGGVDIHPFVIRHALLHSAEVVEYQVCQTATGIDVAVAAGGRLDTDEVAKHLQDVLAEAGAPHTRVRVHRVPNIPRNSETGKVRRFIPLAEARS